MEKKPRGRPRKNQVETDIVTKDQTRDVRPLLEKLIARKKLGHLKDALEQLEEIHNYVTDSIDFGEYAGYKQCTIEELEHLLEELFAVRGI